MEATRPIDRAGLLARHEALWEALAAAFSGVDGDAAARARAGEWSAKDHLAHVVAWEHHRLGVLAGEDLFAATGFTAAELATGSEDELNARLAARYAEEPLTAVLAEAAEVRAAIAERLRAMPAERLAVTYRTLHPEDEGRGDGPVGEWAIGIAEAHVGAHLGPIRARLMEARGETPPTVAGVLRRLDAAARDLLAAVERTANSTKTDEHGWRVADHALHVAAWDRGCVALLEGANRREAIGIGEELWRSGDTDAINAAILAASRDRTVAEAVAALTESRGLLRDVVATLEDDDLLAAYGAFQSDDRPLSFAPVYGWVAENGWTHPAEHATAMSRLGGVDG